METQDKAVKSSTVVINKGRCKGCACCVYFCARDVLAMSEETNQRGYLLPTVADQAKCSGCRLCEAICPDFAIHVISTNADEEQEE